MVRTIVAVASGYALFAGSTFALFAITGLRPHVSASTGIMVGSIGYGVAAAMLAGYVAARLGQSRPMMHAALVGGLIAIAALVSIAMRPQNAALWSHWAALFLMAPAALVGGIRSGEE
jgi:hypothetical protein